MCYGVRGEGRVGSSVTPLITCGIVKELNSMAASIFRTQVQFRSQLTDLLLFSAVRAVESTAFVSMTTARTTEVCDREVMYWWQKGEKEHFQVNFLQYINGRK